MEVLPGLSIRQVCELLLGRASAGIACFATYRGIRVQLRPDDTVDEMVHRWWVEANARALAAADALAEAVEAVPQRFLWPALEITLAAYRAARGEGE